MSEYLKILKRSWLSVLLISVFMTLFSLIVLIVTGFAEMSDDKTSMFINFVSAFLVVIIVWWAEKRRKRQIKTAFGKDLSAKLDFYVSVFRKQVLTYGIVTVICLIDIFITKAFGIIMFDILALLLLVINRPSEIKTKFDLNLTGEDIKAMDAYNF